MEELSPEPQQETVQSGSSTTDSQDPSSENKTQSKTDTSLEEKTNTGSETKLGVKPNESDVSLASQDTEVTSRQGDKLESSSQILETSEGEDEILEAPYGGSLSLARIQSLVSMTTPRDGSQPHLKGQVPPFVEFDLSIDGFGCLFFPSLFPQSIDQVQLYVQYMYIQCMQTCSDMCMYCTCIVLCMFRTVFTLALFL